MRETVKAIDVYQGSLVSISETTPVYEEVIRKMVAAFAYRIPQAQLGDNVDIT